MTTQTQDPAGQEFIDGLRRAAGVGADDHHKHVYNTYADLGEAQNRMADAAQAFGKLSNGEMRVILTHHWGEDGGWTAIDGKWPMQEGGPFGGPFAHGDTLPAALRGLAEVLEAVDPMAESIRRVMARSGLPAFIPQ